MRSHRSRTAPTLVETGSQADFDVLARKPNVKVVNTLHKGNLIGAIARPVRLEKAGDRSPSVHHLDESGIRFSKALSDSGTLPERAETPQGQLPFLGGRCRANVHARRLPCKGCRERMCWMGKGCPNGPNPGSGAAAPSGFVSFGQGLIALELGIGSGSVGSNPED